MPDVHQTVLARHFAAVRQFFDHSHVCELDRLQVVPYEMDRDRVLWVIGVDTDGVIDVAHSHDGDVAGALNDLDTPAMADRGLAWALTDAMSGSVELRMTNVESVASPRRRSA